MPEPFSPAATAALAAFNAATGDLLMPSERDHPFIPVILGMITLSPQTVAQALDIPLNTPVSVQSFEHFFTPLTTRQPWHTTDDLPTLVGFAGLRDTLAAYLRDPVVYRFGEGTVTVLIIGYLDDGTVAGVQTKVIET
ncbi:MAG: hypothetical protein KatS3mg055_2042 [Chloroflexus sp.]|uniref:nuclease A inhibitor family protein n=1 Tax=Chloroflexus sp. TaxID=1904827 RepID=UPI0021DCC9B3|nr:nuclease A inhibitor family protein [Chloroflexus sp.]GIV89524.1 MAG: hypothetical protein KatS3mg055_2042 [Chloroflexus sp.]